MVKFSLVGLSGVLVNMGMLALLREIAGFPLWLASPLAIEVSILSNFTLNDLWTWGDRRFRKYWGRLWRYHLSVGITGFGINYPIFLALTYLAKLPYFWANIIGIGFASAGNFLLNHFWTYKKLQKFD